MCDPAKAAHKTFSVSVDKRSRKAMEAYLSGHFRYYTMNSWNRSTSYACNMKLYRLGLEEETMNTLYDMIQVPEFYDKLSTLIQDFNMAHDYQWQAGWNGRSGGYLVLYQGEKTPSKYRSFCRKCGQKNFKSVAETDIQCGVCGRKARVDFITPPMNISTFPGRGTDQDEEFGEWSKEELRQRTTLVQEFDRLADAIVSEAVYMAHTYKVVEETEYMPVSRLRLA